MPGQQYYWSVQAVDTAFAGSVFSAESEFINETDGVPASVEDGAPNDGDGNSDGIPDSQQANVASLPNQESGAYVTIVSPEGTGLVDVTPIDPPAGLPVGVDFPVGFFSYQVIGLPVGGETSVTFILHGGESVNTFYKSGNARRPNAVSVSA